MTSPIASGPARAALLAIACLSAGCAEPELRRPNVVVVVIDTLRSDRLPFYGCESTHAPFLTSIAERGLVFDEAWAASSWTAPSTASLFTGLYPDQHGVKTGLVVYERTVERGRVELRLGRIPEQLETLPERFKAAGYRTFGVADNPNVCERLGFAEGFDHFETLDYAGADALCDVARDYGEELASSDAPFLLYLHLMDPHSPYHERAPWFDAEAATAQRPYAAELAAYDSEIAFADEQLARLFGELDLGDDELVVLTADHGEEFGDHGSIGHDFKLYEELLAVPLVFAGPGITGGGRSAEPVSLIDLLPTLADLCGLPPAADLDGRSLRGILEGDTATLGERLVHAERTRENLDPPRTLSAVRDGRMKLISDLSKDALELYDLERDPFELRDIEKTSPEVARGLLVELRSFERRGARVERQFAVPLDPDDESLSVLERLGYVR
ncbi:sulfatase [Engelhardtia mirabilis]|uniref:Choline-sulfatase n=1 Tax=Engelhardtia mirabilis TaxID=2528011 RepID=A0A518BMV7_9BACT|nr:Choline-sulfatase [Planctomycetes bacterium Pla133]QDV02634.1 Choline-sulfatase [Planctomycetes bacterium Pla86]